MQTARIKTDFSDTELQRYVKAVQQVITIEEENHYKMMEAIAESNLTVDRFKELQMEGQLKGNSATNIFNLK